MAQKFQNFGILQIDAHCDLRDSYEGFEYSHASVFNNVLKLPQVKKLVQVGVRDLCDEEINIIKQDSRIKTFFNHQINQLKFSGSSWEEVCDDIISNLPENVYVSFDIDGLLPFYCPNTGTPVPGGLEFDEQYICYKLKQSEKNNRF